MKQLIFKTLLIFCFFNLQLARSQDLPSFEFTDTWLDSIAALAPSKPTIPVGEPKHVLIFSLHTGYDHWVIPHTEAVMKMLATRPGIAAVTTSRDIADFRKENLAKFDAVILNNTCPEPDRRDIFYDVLSKDKSKSEAQLLREAADLEENLLNFVKDGGGLMLLHGGATMQINSPEFSRMAGGSFDFHPRQQLIKVKLATQGHPLLRAFKGNGFELVDEPYFYKNDYNSYNFRPLLYMEANQLEGLDDREIKENKRYLAWIKRYGKGHVFLAAASHNAQNYANPELLQFLQDALQYVLGELECDDSPMKH